jgi:quercetin dioxygenase-like cupin family protein
MALPHAQPLDVIDVRPLGSALHDAVMRLVLPAGQGLPEHSVPGSVTVQCLEGETVLIMPSRTCTLGAGQLVVLEGSEPHALKATADSTLLVTILLHTR